MKLKTIFGALLIGGAMAGAAWANGVNDLKDALARYPATTPLKATAEAKTLRRDGEGKDLDEKTGQASLYFEEGERGVRVSYSKETLNRYAADEQAKEKDAKAKTPTLSALGALTIPELRQLANGIPVLQRQLEKSTFKSEKPDTWNGKPARLLSYDYGIGAMSEKDRKYIKKYEGTLEVWIGADGTPLASRTVQTASGRAYVVVSFDTKNVEDVVYQVNGDRLTVVRKETHNEGAGMGERGESHTIRTLQVLGQ